MTPNSVEPPLHVFQLQLGALLAGFLFSLVAIGIGTFGMVLTVLVALPELGSSEAAMQNFFARPAMQVSFFSMGALCIGFGGVLTAWIAKGKERANVRGLMALWTYFNLLILPWWWEAHWWEILAGLFAPAAFVWLGAVPIELLRGRSIKP